MIALVNDLNTVGKCRHGVGESLINVTIDRERLFNWSFLRHAVARDSRHHQRAPQSFDHKRRDKSAAVGGYSNNELLFPDLRKLSCVNR